MASNTISILISAKDNASKTLRDVSGEMDAGSEKSNKFSSALGSLGGVLGKATLALGAAGAAAGTAGIALGMNFNSSVEQAQTKLTAFMKDGKLVAETLAWVKQEAAATQFSFTDMADAAANLTPVARSSGQSLKDLVKQAEILAAINPAEGLTGATFSLREALSGDWVSIVDRFNLPRQRINQLKAEGVPAMEIISRSLQEMGIDYSLVAAQGQTAAARFDQIKDKLTMMAGAATKPIFDKISKDLDGLNQIDFAAFGESLARGSEKALTALHNVKGAMELLHTGDFKKGLFAAGIQEDSKVVDVLLKIRQAFVDVWNFIKPAVMDIGRIFKTELLPAFQELWDLISPTLLPALKVLAYVLGVTIVGGVWLLVNALTLGAKNTKMFFDLAGAQMNFLKDAFLGGINLIVQGWQGAVAFFASIPGFFSNLWVSVVSGAQSGVAAIGDFFVQLPNRIAFGLGVFAGLLTSFVTQDIPNFVVAAISWFASLPERIGLALAMMYIGARDWFSRMGQDVTTSASSTVSNVGNWFQSLPGRVAAAASSMWSGAVAAFNGFKDSVVAWAESTVNNIVSLFTQLPGRISGAIQGAFNKASGDVSNFLSGLGDSFNKGFKIGNAHATGTVSAPGGRTLVGEMGPEIVNMPQGAQVIPAYRSRATGAGGGGVSMSIANLTIANQMDEQRFLANVGWRLSLR